MKKVLALFSVLGLIIGLSSFAPASGGVTVKVKKGKIAINGKAVVPGWGIGLYKTALGEPDRTRDGYNKTHTYDTKSIVLFEKMENKVASGIVSEVQFHFSVPEKNEVTPKGNFTGTIKVDKLTVTKDLTPSVMLAKLKGWAKTDSYMEHSFRMASKGLYIYFQFSDDEKSLLKISIGPDKKS